jgi:hypothetical protein
MLLSEYLNKCIQTKDYFFGDDLSYTLENILQQCASINLDRIKDVKTHIKILNTIVFLIKTQEKGVGFHIEPLFKSMLEIVQYLDLVDEENKLKREEY